MPDEPQLLRDAPDFLDRLKSMTAISTSEGSSPSLLLWIDSLSWWQNGLICATCAICTYCLVKTYKFLKGRNKSDARSEIDKINELYRGLNNEDTLLQQKLEKHLNWIITLKQAQTLAYVGVVGVIFWCYRQPSVL